MHTAESVREDDEGKKIKAERNTVILPDGLCLGNKTNIRIINIDSPLCFDIKTVVLFFLHSLFGKCNRSEWKAIVDEKKKKKMKERREWKKMQRVAKCCLNMSIAPENHQHVMNSLLPQCF